MGNIHQTSYYFVQDKSIVNQSDTKNEGGHFKTAGTNWHFWQTDQQLSQSQGVIKKSTNQFGMIVCGGMAIGVAAPFVIEALPSLATASATSRAGGVGVDYLSQVAGNYVSGKTGMVEAWYGNINRNSLLVSAFNPGSSIKQLAVNNTVSSFFSATPEEGYNGIGGGKSFLVASLQAFSGTIAGSVTSRIPLKLDKLGGRLANVNSLYGAQSPLSMFLQNQIRNTKWIGTTVGVVTAGGANAINNQIEKKP
ncbi:hypothetical protein [Ferruginibacter profundus]